MGNTNTAKKPVRFFRRPARIEHKDLAIVLEASRAHVEYRRRQIETYRLKDRDHRILLARLLVRGGW